MNKIVKNSMKKSFSQFLKAMKRQEFLEIYLLYKNKLLMKKILIGVSALKS
jgi:hypothetical protein